MTPREPVRELPRRRPSLDLPDHWSGRWHPALPELEAVADAVSLSMPHVEPFVIRAVGTALPMVDGALAERTRGYLDQEMAHQRIHREFNRLAMADSPGAAWIDRAGRAVFRRLRRRSPAFALAFAAAAEALAYLTARWVCRHQRSLLGGAEPWARELFLWHLAEEVEHKDVARAVFDRVDGSRLRYAAGLGAALVILGSTAVVGGALLLWERRRLHRPTTWVRLTRWSLGYAFDLLPSLAATISRHHAPGDFADPSWFALHLTTCRPDPGSRGTPR